VCGGRSNRASGFGSVVCGGGWDFSIDSSLASGDYSAILGGCAHLASGNYSVVIGGIRNTSTGDYSFSFGRHVKVSGKGSIGFVYGSGSWGDTAVVADSFDVVFGDGEYQNYEFGINRLNPDYPLHIGTNSSNGNGAHLTEGGTWTNGSSREFKEDFRELNSQQVLEKIANLSVMKWSFKGTDEQHVGPVAEDFYDLFGLGVGDPKEDSKYIAASDMAGVSMVAIQELAQIVEELRAENQELRQEIKELKTQ
jgi:hypothetical protein